MTTKPTPQGEANLFERCEELRGINRELELRLRAHKERISELEERYEDLRWELAAEKQIGADRLEQQAEIHCAEVDSLKDRIRDLELDGYQDRRLIEWLDGRLGTRDEFEYLIEIYAPHDPDEPALSLREAVKVAQEFEQSLLDQDRS